MAWSEQEPRPCRVRDQAARPRRRHRSRLYGNDYIAGGAGEDEIFGQLGHDVIQGDGTIGLGEPAARWTVVRASRQPAGAAQLSLTRTDGSTVAITDFTTFGANRGAVPTALADFGFNMDPSQDLQVRASFEGRFDGDDYIEGGGGNDVVFGNRGQDDIVGGSSDLFGLVAANQRPDGSDLLFGGAGTDITRNDIGDATTAAVRPARDCRRPDPHQPGWSRQGRRRDHRRQRPHPAAGGRESTPVANRSAASLRPTTGEQFHPTACPAAAAS
jgi:hypothetical protein